MEAFRDRDQAGFSLVELLVVLVVLGIVSGVVLRSTVTSLEASRRSQARVLALADLTKGLERIGRELRAADPLDLSRVPSVDRAPYEVGAAVVRDGRVLNYRYYLTDPADGPPELREDIDVYQLDGVTPIPSEDREGLFIVNTVNFDVGVPLLTYYDEKGNEMSCTTPVTLSLDDCRAYLAAAQQVKLTLVRSLPEQNPVTVETFINVRTARFT